MARDGAVEAREDPAEVAAAEGTLATTDGRSLFWRAWEAPRPQALLVFAHGLLEHCGRYREPALYFARRGYACWAFDFRGHGRSSGRRVHVSGFDEFLLDLSTVLDLARSHHPGLPVVLLGHSHGGLVALLHVLRRPEGVLALVLSSPFLGLHPKGRPGAAQALTVRVLSRLTPGLRLGLGVDPRGVSRDPEVVEAYAHDPLVSRKASVRWFTSATGAMAEVRAKARHLAVPTLLLLAGQDHLVDAAASVSFAEAAPPGRVEQVLWPGLFHELLNEPEKEEVYAKIEAWLRPPSDQGASPVGPRLRPIRTR